MVEIQQDNILENWLSTYQSLTIGQLLEDYGLTLSDLDVIEMLKKKTSFYYQILMIPLLNVLNGIILEQTKEYQLFLQKMFVDYLMSGESDKTGEELGGEMRRQLENERKDSLEVSEQFEKIWREYQETIAKSQMEIKAFANQLVEYLAECQRKAQFIFSNTDKSVTISIKYLQTLLVDANGFEIQDSGWARFEEKIPQPVPQNLRETLMPEFEKMKQLQSKVETIVSTYLPVVNEQKRLLNQFRKTFYDKIGIVQNALFQMPGFKFDELQDAKNRARLNFDPQIGADH